jgi:cytochrome b
MAVDSAANSRVVRVQVWDAPVRLVHWLVATLVGFMWWTAETGRMDYHRYSGYVLLGLVTFRIYWGMVGSSTARFSEFVQGPRAIVAYLRAQSPVAPGHNPLGALSVIALLTLLLTQITLGLFAVDIDGIESGPLSTYVSFDAGRACAEWHGTLFNILLGLISLHVVAVLFYVLYKRENLLAAMLHGKRDFVADNVQPTRFASSTRLIIGILIAAAFAYAVARAFQFS